MTAIPTFACIEGCTDCCGPVPFSNAERAAVEARYSIMSWEKIDGMNFLTGALQTGTCPFAQSGCQAYDLRPIICRLYGAVDHPRMRCPHGCGPETKMYLTDAEAAALIHN